MKKRYLGIDTGTNSLGWAVVDYDEDRNENRYEYIASGVNIFSEGVKIEKGNESSKAAERTMYKHQRLGYWRRKVRKIKLLEILSENRLCPFVSKEELRAWRTSKVYPVENEAFMAWLSTDEKENRNPYYYRNLCLNETLDLSLLSNRYILGRAIYHLNQRRGFLSNRKEETKESDGAVTAGISEIDKSMQNAGFDYLGEYFYSLYKRHDRIRAHYTHRINHYEKELLAICKKQGLSETLTAQLRKEIISQRPLKSQKQSVGKCVFEPSKPRCPMSHPLYEQYRMYAFINNIKIQTPKDNGLRPLTDEEKTSIIPLFLRKSKKAFKFDEIARKLSASKNNYCYVNDVADKAYKFNYYMDETVSGCNVIAQLTDAFGVSGSVDAWLDAACEVYTQGEGKNRFEIMNDIWHALFFFDDASKLKMFAINKLQMDEASADKFSEIKIPSGYASLSLKAIRKILPYMKRYGMIYSHAVFMANLAKVVHCAVDKDELLPVLPKDEADDIVKAFYEYDPKNSELRTREDYVKRYLVFKYNLDEEGERRLKLLYHPSMIENFPKVRKPEPEGYFQLGSPRSGSMRNPMAMRSLFRLRHVVNTLLKEGVVDEQTTIRIEFARELNDSNRRAAIRRWQNENETENKRRAERIKEHFDNGFEPTLTDVLKYKLWEEQDGCCLYTGKKIEISDLFDPDKYDIEHTVPRSVGGDSTDMNLTLCDSRFNREVKGTKLPSELANHDEILERIASWKERYEKLDFQIRKCVTRGMSDKSAKDNMIQKRHFLKLKRDYWKGKYDRFTMKDVSSGFSRSQGVDISIISKYARSYLRSLFHDVYVVKGIATSDFRKIWGLQEEYEKKQRVNHCHHAIDAVTIACIGKAEYDKLAQYYHDEERHAWGLDNRRAMFDKPWNTFAEDIKNLSDTLLVSHYTADNAGKYTRKRERKNGKLTGRIIQGDTARGALHQETYYGAIKRNEKICYVVRRELAKVDPAKFKTSNIVDDVVRLKVENAIKEHGNLKKAVEAGIWMNKDKGIKINKVRMYTPDITRPLDIRKHRDVSQKEYKQTFHVANDTNYAMGIYVGLDKRGKEKREYKLVNLLDASGYYNSDNPAQGTSLFPTKSESGFSLRWVLKTGTMVLLYQDSPEEVYDLDRKELSKRLYKITGLSSLVVTGHYYGTLSLVHHQEARPSTEVKLKNGVYVNGEELRAGIKFYHTQFRALVQGQDFEFNDIGEIKFLHR